MKYIKSIIIIFFIASLNTEAQTPPYLKWAKCYGGSNDEKGELTTLGPGITRTPDDFILITGLSNSLDGDIGNNKGGADIVLLKIDTSGNVIWSRNYGGSASDGGCKTYIMPDLNYLIIGNTGSSNGDVTGFKGLADVFVLKVDKNNGNIIWKKTYGGSFDESPYCAVIDSNSITMACYTRSVDLDIQNRIGPISNIDIWIIKIDFNGNIIWQKPIDGSAADYPTTMIKSNGNYFIIGSTLSNDYNYTGNHGMKDTWLAKIDNSGNLVWKKCVGGSKDDNPADLIELNNGNFLALINTYSKDGDATGAPSPSKVKMFYIFKDDGTKAAVHFFGSDIFADGVDIVQREDSTFLISQHNPIDSIRISFMDTAYNIYKRITYGSNSVSSTPPSEIILAPNNYIYAIRETYGNTGEIIGSHGGHDFWVIKIKLPAVKIYPKPPSPPTRPFNLQCTKNNLDLEIKLTWQDTGSSNRSIWVYRSLNDTLNYILYDSAFPITHQYTDMLVINGQRYFYKVAGVNNQGKLYSNTCDTRPNAGINAEAIGKLKVYPNPFKETVIISSMNGERIQSVQVFDQTGQLVETKREINSNTVSYDTRKWATGIYYLKVFFSESTYYQISITKK